MNTAPASTTSPAPVAEREQAPTSTHDVPVVNRGLQTPESAAGGVQTPGPDPLAQPTAQELLVARFRASRGKTYRVRSDGSKPSETPTNDVTEPTEGALRKVQNRGGRGVIPPELRAAALRPAPPPVSTYEATGVLILRSDGAVVFPTHGELTPVLRMERLLSAVQPLTFDEYAAAQIAGEAADSAREAEDADGETAQPEAPLTPLYRITVSATATPVPAKDLASLWATARSLPRKPTDPWLADAKLATRLERECECSRCAYCLIFPLMLRLAQGILSTS